MMEFIIEEKNLQKSILEMLNLKHILLDDELGEIFQNSVISTFENNFDMKIDYDYQIKGGSFYILRISDQPFSNLMQ